MKGKSTKKWANIILLIIFVPSALYLLATGMLFYFFILAGLTYGASKLIDKIISKN